MLQAINTRQNEPSQPADASISAATAAAAAATVPASQSQVTVLLYIQCHFLSIID